MSWEEEKEGEGDEGNQSCVSLSSGLNLQPGGTCFLLPREIPCCQVVSILHRKAEHPQSWY